MNSAIRDLWIELHSDVRAAKVVPALSAGLTSGLGLLCAQVAFGTFIASGGGRWLHIPRR